MKLSKLIVGILAVGVLIVSGIRSISGAGYRNFGNLNLLWAMRSNNNAQMKLEKGERYLKQAIDADPQRLSLYRSLGEIMILKGEYTEAETTFTVSSADSKIAALQLLWLYAMGMQDLSQKRFDDAYAIRDVMLRLSSSSPPNTELTCASRMVEYALEQSWGFRNEEDHEAGDLALQFAIALAPECPDAYYRLGLLRNTQESYEEAIVAYQQGIARDSKTVSCGYGYLAASYLDLEKLDEVVRSAESSLQYGDGPRAAMLLGRVNQMRGDLPRAREYYLMATRFSQKCDQDDWSQWMAYFYLGWIAFDQAEYDSAISYMLLASQLSPGTAGEAQALKYVGDMYRQRGLLQEAIPTYQKALSLAPPGWDWILGIHLALADAYRDAGQVDLAIQEYNNALQWVPNDPYIVGELLKLQQDTK